MGTNELSDNSIRGNLLSGLQQPPVGTGTAIGSGNTITGNSPDVDAMVTIIPTGCNRIGAATTCPP